MKRVGIIGGLSPESTIFYYTHLTRSYVRTHGDCSYPDIIIYSVSLEQYHRWRNEGRWDLIAQDLARAGRALESCGAEVGVIATNTMHKVFREVQAELAFPLLNIVDLTVAAVLKSGVKTVGLIGTRFTMTDPFFSEPLQRQGIRVVVPEAEQIEEIHRVIENELVRNEIREESRQRYLAIIDQMIGKGIEGLILGCTEIPLLISGRDTDVPLFDTAMIHAEALFAEMTR